MLLVYSAARLLCACACACACLANPCPTLPLRIALMGLGLVNTANSLLTQKLTNPIDKTIELIVMNPVTGISE